ncbi:MAG: beta-propeller fold lactonase family protein [Solirubrobacterales bacterium]
MKRPLLIISCAAACLLAVGPAGARERSIFATQQLGAVGITTFSVDLESGALTEQAGVNTTLDMPSVPSVSPDGKLLFVGDYAGGIAQSFTPLPTGPSAITGATAPTGAGPNATIADPGGAHLWSANYDDGSIGSLGVASGGLLTALPGSPTTTGGAPTALAVSPQNDLLYAPTYGGETIAGFRRGADGSLTALAGFPLVHSGDPIDVEFNTNGTDLFVANQDDGSISSFAVDQTSGALTEVSGSPLAVGGRPTGLAASPNGKYLLVADQDGDSLSSYAIAGDGTLSPVDSATTGSSPDDVIISPDGRFAYSANFWGGTISGFTVDSDGSLTELADSPFGDASGAMATFTMTPNQGPIAALSTSSDGNTATFDATASSDPDGSVAGYSWSFGDGQSATGAPGRITHTYAAPGTYTARVTTTDDEGCSDTQIGTGQTLYCNGSLAARAQQEITVANRPALKLSNANGAQARSRRNGRKVTRRLRTRFKLSEKANVTFRFQKSRRGGACRRSRASTSAVGFRNFGKRMTRPARAGSNQRTFARTLGGRRLSPGRYRVQLQARASDGRTSTLVTTRSFCVR